MSNDIGLLAALRVAETGLTAAELLALPMDEYAKVTGRTLKFQPPPRDAREATRRPQEPLRPRRTRSRASTSTASPWIRHVNLEHLPFIPLDSGDLDTPEWFHAVKVCQGAQDTVRRDRMLVRAGLEPEYPRITCSTGSRLPRCCTSCAVGTGT